MPLNGAASAYSIFIASSVSSFCPLATVSPAATSSEVTLPGDLLRPEMLLHGHRIIGSALYRGIVAQDHGAAPGDIADPADDARAGNVAFIQAISGKLADFEEGRAGIEQPLDPFPGQQLAPCGMPIPRLFAAAQGRLRHTRAQFPRQRPVMARARLCFGACRIVAALQDRPAHRAVPISSRPISIRLISLVPAPMSSSLASRR